MRGLSTERASSLLGSRVLAAAPSPARRALLGGALGLLPVFLAAQCGNASIVLTAGSSGLSGQLLRADPRRHVNVDMLSQGSALVSGRSCHKSRIKNAHSGAVEMAQQVKASIAQPGDPGLMPGPARWEERTDTYRLSPTTDMCTATHVCTHMHTCTHAAPPPGSWLA